MSENLTNIVQLFENHVATNGSKPAIIETSRKTNKIINFSELQKMFSSVAQGLLSNGLKSGDRVIVMVPMSIDLYVILLGLFKIGATAVFVDPWISMKQIAAFSSFAEPKGFIGVPKSHIYRLLNSDLFSLPLTVTTGARFLNFPAKLSLKNLLKYPPLNETAVVSEDTPALITFTTGSSGIPKGANRTHGFLHAQHQALQQEFPYEDEDCDLSMFPVFALNNLARGITTIIPYMNFKKVSEVDSEFLFDQIKSHNVKTITASPPLFDRLAKNMIGTENKCDFRRILVGGGAITDEQLKHWKTAFPNTEIVIVYGSTEAEPTAHISADDRLRLNTSFGSGICVGKVSTLLKSAVIPIDKSKNPIKTLEIKDIALSKNGIGELIVSGQHVCRDYFRNPEAVSENKIILTDGCIWHRMGDTGYFDNEDNFWLCGRVHSTIVRRGESYHAQLIENAILFQVPEISSVAALGVPHSEVDELLYIVANLKTTESNASEIISKIQTALENINTKADKIIIRNEPLPVDPRHNTKIIYSTLRKELKN